MCDGVPERVGASTLHEMNQVTARFSLKYDISSPQEGMSTVLPQRRGFAQYSGLTERIHRDMPCSTILKTSEWRDIDDKALNSTHARTTPHSNALQHTRVLGIELDFSL